jgi:hypothetical protein
MPSSFALSPVEYCRGTTPSHAAEVDESRIKQLGVRGSKCASAEGLLGFINASRILLKNVLHVIEAARLTERL